MDDEELNRIRMKKAGEYMSKPAGKPVQLSDAEFEHFIKENQLAVVDCYADWCMPCRMVSPIIEELSGEMNNVTFAKLNVDENQGTAMKFGIMSIPTILIFKGGKLVDQIVGALPKAALKSRIQSAL
jgi:thioredoxin 1